MVECFRSSWVEQIPASSKTMLERSIKSEVCFTPGKRKFIWRRIRELKQMWNAVPPGSHGQPGPPRAARGLPEVAPRAAHGQPGPPRAAQGSPAPPGQPRAARLRV